MPSRALEQPHELRAEYTPDFILSQRGIIHEDNWPQYEAKGFFVTAVTTPSYLLEELTLAQEVYGTEYVYTGDYWSYLDERPLRHASGIGIYVHPDGMANVPRWRAKHFPTERQAGGEPSAS